MSPKPVVPLAAITPITVNARLWIRICSPIMASPLSTPSSGRTLAPSTATFRRPTSSRVPNIRPWAILNPRTSRKFGAVPVTCTFVFLFLQTTWSGRSCCQFTATTFGDRSLIMSTSFVVSFTVVPVPTPPCCTRCGLIWRTVVPRRSMRSRIEFCAPFPSATIAMTAAIPITIPSIVRADRILLARSAARATPIVSVSSIGQRS